MSVKVEGIPEGWELIKFDYANDGDWYMTGGGVATVHLSPKPTQAKRLIIRKIEKPKQYRPFANGAEFLAHPLSGDWIDIGADEFAKVSQCNDSGIWFSGYAEIQHYEDAFVDLRFRDGTPFGVEVV